MSNAQIRRLFSQICLPQNEACWAADEEAIDEDGEPVTDAKFVKILRSSTIPKQCQELIDALKE